LLILLFIVQMTT